MQQARHFLRYRSKRNRYFCGGKMRIDFDSRAILTQGGDVRDSFVHTLEWLNAEIGVDNPYAGARVRGLICRKVI